MQRDNYKVVEGKLYSYKNNILKVQNLALEIEKTKNECYSIGAVGYEERISGTNVITSSVENEIIRKDEKIAVLERQKKQLEYEIQQVENSLKILNDVEAKMIEKRYFENKTYLQMTYIFPYSHTSLIRNMKKIISKIEYILYF